jgi:nitrite reductase/ring-hydroxylating ferredoxin subunit
MGDWLPAMKSSELREGSISTVDLNGKHVLLSRLGGEVYAVGGTCTHEDTDLGLGFVVEDRVVCPLHLSQFELKTGRVVNPPATAPLEAYGVKETDGMIFIEV